MKSKVLDPLAMPVVGGEMSYGRYAKNLRCPKCGYEWQGREIYYRGEPVAMRCPLCKHVFKKW